MYSKNKNEYQQTKFPHCVIPVHSSNEYCYEPTHCAFEVRPSVVLTIAWYGILARLVKRLSDECSDVRFLFPNTRWLTLDEDKNSIEQQIIEEGGFTDEDEIGKSFDVDDDDLCGCEIRITPSSGGFMLVCFHKHSGDTFFTEEIGAGKMFNALRFEHVLAEIEYSVLRLKARATLRKLAA
ncbi:MAG: hypothetical protein HYR70_04465 [Chloroflexi bacterium]|nr:hypothetical protein [Chloroflexota bacterium]MBI3340810.1 hypothetical protein [Chloroflexota bacterium]